VGEEEEEGWGFAETPQSLQQGAVE
jgi:hypothetical protein